MIDLGLLPHFYGVLLQGLVAFCRIGAFVATAPLFGSRLMPKRVRLVMALALTVGALPGLPAVDDVVSLSPRFWLLIGHEVFVGLAIGFATQIFFHMFVIAGQVVAMQMGLGFASMFDPDNGVTVTVLSQFYLLLVQLLFLAMNGHLVLFQVVIESFNYAASFGIADAAQITRLGAFMFAGGLLIALPSVTALLLVNLAFGVLTRAAPQLNVFSLGFPITMLFGVVVVWISSAGWLPQFDGLAAEFFVLLRQSTT